MTEYVLLGVCWLLLSLPVSVLLGKCIAVGQAGETERHATAAAGHEPAPAGVQAAAAHARPEASLPEVPAQRQPTVSPHMAR